MHTHTEEKHPREPTRESQRHCEIVLSLAVVNGVYLRITTTRHGLLPRNGGQLTIYFIEVGV